MSDESEQKPDDIVQRLRGFYWCGPGQPLRDFGQFVPPISLEAATEISRLRARVADLEKNQRMSNESAREYLGENFSGLLWSADELSATKRPWISCCSDSAFVELAGSFTASDLESIACWMRDPKGVAGI